MTLISLPISGLNDCALLMVWVRGAIASPSEKGLPPAMGCDDEALTCGPYS